MMGSTLREEVDLTCCFRPSVSKAVGEPCSTRHPSSMTIMWSNIVIPTSIWVVAITVLLGKTSNIALIEETWLCSSILSSRYISEIAVIRSNLDTYLLVGSSIIYTVESRSKVRARPIMRCEPSEKLHSFHVECSLDMMSTVICGAAREDNKRWMSESAILASISRFFLTVSLESALNLCECPTRRGCTASVLME